MIVLIVYLYWLNEQYFLIFYLIKLILLNNLIPISIEIIVWREVLLRECPPGTALIFHGLIFIIAPVHNTHPNHIDKIIGTTDYLGNPKYDFEEAGKKAKYIAEYEIALVILADVRKCHKETFKCIPPVLRP